MYMNLTYEKSKHHQNKKFISFLISHRNFLFFSTIQVMMNNNNKGWVKREEKLSPLISKIQT